MSFAAGSLVRARGREWVVLPESSEQLLVVRPLAGTDEEIAGIYLGLESVEPAAFALPASDDLGDFRSGQLLRDALRLGFRHSTSPFRSLAHIAVEPRPYQLVPLLMAVKLDPVRLLIADDVGVGKTIEAGLVAREAIDQGVAERLAVLCPPHLADQWQRELSEKFHIEAELILPSTTARLERGLAIGESVFERYPYVIVSTDFIKSDRRWEEFARACPEFVIVDEAHTCADPTGGKGRHQRYRLVSRLSSDPTRHLVLVTATPHSGKEEAFHTLLRFLDTGFADLAEDISTRERERRRLARHFVQRRREDIAHYLQTDTPFPSRDPLERTYTLSAEYKAFFERVLRYCRETVREPAGRTHRQRVRWWAALALLRALGSSPAAAAATLRERAKSADTATAQEADEVGRRAVLDLADDESAEGTDVAPGADPGEDGASMSPARRRLLALAAEADQLVGQDDRKLTTGVKLVRELVTQGFHPIVFCRFIETAEYVAKALRDALPRSVAVEAVTGRLPAAERENRVTALAANARHVLVATDCLSEGINLQEHFDAVLHYDLSWNPTRHEQRDGRVDRFNQPQPVVKVITYYGSDNPIDGLVLNVLLRKHRAIRDSLGISVPVPVDSNKVLEAILEGLLFSGRPEDTIEGQLTLFEKDIVAPRRIALHREWEQVANKERRSRTVFAQEGIRVDEVAREMAVTRAAIGSGAEVAQFVRDGLRAHGAVVSQRNGAITADLRELPRGLRDVLARDGTEFKARFDLPVRNGEEYLSRTHPFVESLAGYVLDTALDPHAARIARRAGVARTLAAKRRTTLMLLRLRFDLITRRRSDRDRRLLAEEARLVAFTGPPDQAEWLDGDEAERLLQAAPDANIAPEQARHFLQRVLDGFDHLSPWLEQVAQQRAAGVLESYERVRAGARLTGLHHAVEPKLPVDVLGIYVYLPAG
jgi:superfamily II DNA or RNA helicase